MFNVLVIVALSAAVAAKSGSSAKIDHRVVARDVTFYASSIIILVASARDGMIQWWEVRRGCGNNNQKPMRCVAVLDVGRMERTVGARREIPGVGGRAMISAIAAR